MAMKKAWAPKVKNEEVKVKVRTEWEQMFMDYGLDPEIAKDQEAS